MDEERPHFDDLPAHVRDPRRTSVEREENRLAHVTLAVVAVLVAVVVAVFATVTAGAIALVVVAVGGVLALRASGERHANIPPGTP